MEVKVGCAEVSVAAIREDSISYVNWIVTTAGEFCAILVCSSWPIKAYAVTPSRRYWSPSIGGPGTYFGAGHPSMLDRSCAIQSRQRHSKVLTVTGSRVAGVKSRLPARGSSSAPYLRETTFTIDKVVGNCTGGRLYRGERG